jgi:DNA-binding transcriptional LysR family regulator
MLLRQMKYFVTVVDCNSFTEAAERCYISQSAISQQIQSLEKDLGVELIHRENRGFTLTPAGSYFYGRSRDLLEEAEKIRLETIRIGRNAGLHLRVGYLKCYSGLELHLAVAEFSQRYPDVALDIVNGTHEELYALMRSGGVDLILSDQRRAFDEDYVNCELLQSDCYVELSSRNPLSELSQISPEELKDISCILISSKEQQEHEQEFYRETLGFGGNFLFAENLEEGRLMVAGNRGFLPVEGVGTLPPPNFTTKRLPLYRNGRQIRRKYCSFWNKDRTNDYIEEFGDILCDLLHDENMQ